jgi:hypothetical protein
MAEAVAVAGVAVAATYDVHVVVAHAMVVVARGVAWFAVAFLGASCGKLVVAVAEEDTWRDCTVTIREDRPCHLEEDLDPCC